MRASIRPYRSCIGAVKMPTIVVKGAVIAPSTCPRRMSTGGSSATRQRVLHDREPRAVLEQASSKRVDLGHRQAAVVGDHDRLRRAQPFGQLRDDALLVFLLHPLTSSKTTRARAQAGSSRE